MHIDIPIYDSFDDLDKIMENAAMHELAESDMIYFINDEKLPPWWYFDEP